MPAEGGDARQLTRGPHDDTHPTWSPDGRELAFARDGKLWVLRVAGARIHQLTKELGGDARDPAWAPSGKLIAYDYRRAGYSSREIWVVRPDGSGAREVTHLDHSSSQPSWSPDGTRIAFASDERRNHSEIYTIKLDGSGLHIETATAIDTIDPAWSPDGKLIAFSRDGSIETVDRSGETQRLTSGKNDAMPAWRPAAETR